MKCEGETCKNYWSCQYMKHRFGVNKCAIGKKIFVNRNHKRELQAREEMLMKEKTIWKI